MKILLCGCVLLMGCDALAPDEVQLGYGWGSVDTEGAVSRAVYETDADTEAFWVAPTWYLSSRRSVALSDGVSAQTYLDTLQALGAAQEALGAASGGSQPDEGQEGDDTQDPEGQEQPTGDVVTPSGGQDKAPWWAAWIKDILLVVLGAGGALTAPKAVQKVKSLRKRS